MSDLAGTPEFSIEVYKEFGVWVISAPMGTTAYRAVEEAAEIWKGNQERYRVRVLRLFEDGIRSCIVHLLPREDR